MGVCPSFDVVMRARSPIATGAACASLIAVVDRPVVGHVSEGRDAAHLVYRTTARMSETVPEVKVMRMRGPGGQR